MEQWELMSVKDEFAAALAAAAFAIHSLEETKLGNEICSKEENLFKRTRSSTILSTRSNNSTFEAHPPSRRKSSSTKTRSNDHEIGSNTRIIEEAPSWQQQAQQRWGLSTADSWERDQLQKIDTRYKKMRSKIAEWETDKKMKVKVQLEKRKAEIERQRVLVFLDYAKKTGWIDSVSRGARAQVEDRKTKDESRVKQKSRQFAATGELPRVKHSCFYFKCC